VESFFSEPRIDRLPNTTHLWCILGPWIGVIDPTQVLTNRLNPLARRHCEELGRKYFHLKPKKKE
jgi:hypothetical protein